MKYKNLTRLIIILLLGISVFSFIVTKSAVSSFTHDESFTYLHYVHQSFMDIVSYEGAFTNNHLLNTLFMKYSEQLFGSSELALRLPNLLLLLVFLTYTFLFFKKSDPVLCVSVFTLMSTNVALIDFFGLARGYGMSIGFMVMGLHHLVQSFHSDRDKHLALFNIGSLLAILSNFTLLDFYVAAVFVYNLVKFLENRFLSSAKFNIYKVNRVNIISLVLIASILYEPIRKVVKHNAFDFGGNQGFISDTLSSLVYNVLDHIGLDAVETMFFQIIFLLLVLVPLAIIFIKIYRKEKEFFYGNQALIIVNFILLTISITTVVQHYLFQTDYLIGRFSLFLLPLFILNVGFFLEYLLKVRYRLVTLGFAASFAILSALGFIFKANLYSYAEWGYDMETKNAVKALVSYQESIDSKQDSIRLGINWIFEPTINFYRTTWNINWLLPVDRDGLKDSDDYRYIFKSDMEELNLKSYTTIFQSEKTNTLLIKNNNPLPPSQED